jgi:hypothetical protein
MRVHVGHASGYMYRCMALVPSSLPSCQPHTLPPLTRYKCEGWSGNFPPALGVTLEQMIEGHDKFDLTNGTKREAVLRRYSDIDAYRTLREQYYEAKGLTDDYQDIAIQVGAFLLVTCHH